MQKNLFQTGGGPPVPTNVTELDMLIVNSFSAQFEPLVNDFDDDAQQQHVSVEPVNDTINVCQVLVNFSPASSQ